MAAVVNRAPPDGRSYYVVLHLVRENGSHEYYAKRKLPGTPGLTQSFDVTEPGSGPPCQGCDVSGFVTVTPR